MRKILSMLIAAVMVIGMVSVTAFAEGEKKAEVAKKKSGFSIGFSGDAQYRLRYHHSILSDTAGEKIEPSRGDYTNQYAWNFRAKAVMNKNMCFGLRLSNPTGYASDKLSTNLLNVVKQNGERLLSVPEAYFKWNAGIVSLSGGIIPVLSNTTLTLVAYETSKYAKAGTSPWKVMMNNSQVGLDLGLTFLNDGGTKIGFGAISTIAQDAAADTLSPFKRDQLRFIFSIPVSLAENKFSVLPVMHLRTNVFRSGDYEKANHSLVGGVDFGVKPIKQLGFKAGVGVGGYKNDCLKNDSGYSASAPLGLLATVGTVIKPGFGKAMIDFKFSNWKDRELKNASDEVISNSMIHVDLKYAIPVMTLVIMPRFRLWHYIYSENDAATTNLRPEIFFIGKFGKKKK